MYIINSLKGIIYMKIFKLIIKIIILSILLLCSLLGIFAISGYSMYKDTISDTIIKKTFDDIARLKKIQTKE